MHTSQGPSCSVLLCSQQWSMSFEPLDTLEECLISDLVLWNNGCISQGRLTAVTNIPKSPRISTVTVCFAFISQVRDRAWNILWPAQEMASLPFAHSYSMWLHLMKRAWEMIFSTVVRKNGRNKDNGGHQLSLLVWKIHVQAGILSTSRDIPCRKGPWGSRFFFYKIHNCLYQWQC